MRANFGLCLLLFLASSIAAGSAQAASAHDRLTSIAAAFPGGEPIALTAFCIAAGTLLIRLTRWFGLMLTVATFGFIGVMLLIAYQPGMLTRIVEAVTHT